MSKKLTNKDIKEGKKIAVIFSNLSEENKTMAMVYLSALRDKELADKETDKKTKAEVVGV